jgi:hypothetical protein
MAEPQRRQPMTPPPDLDLGICTTCGRPWREHDDCQTTSECYWVRFDRGERKP